MFGSCCNFICVFACILHFFAVVLTHRNFSISFRSIFFCHSCVEAYSNLIWEMETFILARIWHMHANQPNNCIRMLSGTAWTFVKWLRW